jgi:hypothetical protein
MLRIFADSGKAGIGGVVLGALTELRSRKAEWCLIDSSNSESCVLVLGTDELLRGGSSADDSSAGTIPVARTSW